METRNQIEMRDSWNDPLEEAPSEKPKFDAAIALDVAREICAVMTPLCEPERIKVCGSLRRRKARVGDVEIVFVPSSREKRAARMDLFGSVVEPRIIEFPALSVLDDLVERRLLSRRMKIDGTCTWGAWNRLAVHEASGVPVDFFACEELAWWNVVVSRTGGAISNTQICNAAIARNWHWEPSPTKPGFRQGYGIACRRHAVNSEREVFDFVGLPYLEPWERL